MDLLEPAVYIGGLFILRLGVPLAIIMLIGYGLRKLDAKWQAEAQAQLEAEQAAKQHKAEPDLEFYTVIDPPCWVQKNCPETIKLGCPALRAPDIPCWMARYRAEGAIPDKCYACKLFSRRQAEKYIVT